MKLKLSGKAYIVASSDKLALALQETLKNKGMDFQIAYAARDLGISYTAGKPIKHKFNINKVRVKNTKSRAMCTIQISRITNKQEN